MGISTVPAGPLYRISFPLSIKTPSYSGGLRESRNVEGMPANPLVRAESESSTGRNELSASKKISAGDSGPHHQSAKRRKTSGSDQGNHNSESRISGALVGTSSLDISKPCRLDQIEELFEPEDWKRKIKPEIDAIREAVDKFHGKNLPVAALNRTHDDVIYRSPRYPKDIKNRVVNFMTSYPKVTTAWLAIEFDINVHTLRGWKNEAEKK